MNWLYPTPVTTFIHRSGHHVVFEPEEDGWFVVHVPDLPGCISQGADFYDAALNIDSAIEDYLDAQSVADHSPAWAVTRCSLATTEVEWTTTGELSPSFWSSWQGWEEDRRRSGMPY